MIFNDSNHLFNNTVELQFYFTTSTSSLQHSLTRGQLSGHSVTAGMQGGHYNAALSLLPHMGISRKWVTDKAT